MASKQKISNRKITIKETTVTNIFIIKINVNENK